MIFWIYNIALLIFSPLILLFVLYRIFISRKSRKAWRNQMGLVRLPESISRAKPVWIHAVSVGESVASAAVVSEIKSMAPDARIVISTTTQTGNVQAQKSIPEADAFFYYPFDLLPCVYLSLRSVNPAIFASTDTEIWPNFRWMLRRFAVRSALINGTVSDDTLKGASRLPWLYRWALGNIDLFCMQSDMDAERVISIGADPAKVMVTGNIKWDQALADVKDIEVQALRDKYRIYGESPVVVAGSTNPGEDEPVLDAFMKIRERFAGTRLVVAPRQIERKDEIAALALARGLRVSWRSDPSTISGSEDVLILDTFGELAKIYALADVAFVGGSLIPKGCHSILQPIALGKPVFYGPYTFKARDVTAQAERAGVGFRIHSSDEMADRMIELLSSPERLDDIRCKCAELVQSNHGAAAKTAQALLSSNP